MRVILDTNVFVSALAFNSSLNKEIYQRGRSDEFVILMSDELMDVE
jgi:predicted nucleic acid-binding protein